MPPQADDSDRLHQQHLFLDEVPALFDLLPGWLRVLTVRGLAGIPGHDVCVVRVLASGEPVVDGVAERCKQIIEPSPGWAYTAPSDRYG
jgi:hypothetical protein